MKKDKKIEFQVLSTSYDIKKVKDSFTAYCKKDPYYATELQKNFPKLINHYKEIEEQKIPLKADILIVEDDIICIIKYFYLLGLYTKKYSTPTIKNVIACTKSDAVFFVLDNLIHLDNTNPSPKLIILDFDLQEEKETASSILYIVKKIEGYNWYPEFLAVSGFKSKEGAFKDFEGRLRNLHHRTYEKERLDDHSLMLDNLEFLLNRSEHETENKTAFDKLREKGDLAYQHLERIYGKSLVESTILFLDKLENGIRNSCQKKEKLNADTHQILNMKGNYYNSKTLAQQIPHRAKVINALLQLSYHTQYILNRWELFEYQVCHHDFSKKHLKCPKVSLSPKKSE